MIFLTSAAFDFAPTTADPDVILGGLPVPPTERALTSWTPPWPDDGRPAVLLSLSTTYMQQEDLLQRLVDTLGRVDSNALVTTGPGMRAHPVARPPTTSTWSSRPRTVGCSRTST